ncbi:hypothetical protein ACTA71_005031 [Dictyostelium dimigraforme]
MENYGSKKLDGNNVMYSGKNKFGTNFTKTGHVQDMNHIQLLYGNNSNISKTVAGTDDMETETLGADAEEMEEKPLNKSNNGQSNTTDPQGSHNDVDSQKIKNFPSNSIADPNNTVDNKNLLDNKTALKEIFN